MRTALFSLGDGQAALPRLAGHPAAWHQLHAALALGCERIVCLADGPGPALAAIQREAERCGARFHAVSHHRALSGLIAAADTLFVFAPGAIADPQWLAQTLGGRAGVAVLPAEAAAAHPFERIDRDRAWAGVLATRGDAVEALADLPPDGDPVAGLLRVALQRGARAVEVPPAWLDEGRWGVLATADGAARFEAGWYRSRVARPGIEQPGAALAWLAARRLLARPGDPERTAAFLSGGGAVLALASAVGGSLGHIVAGLTGLTAASLLMATGAALAALARAGSSRVPRRSWTALSAALLDAGLLAIAASPVEFAGWTTPFAAAVLIGAMRLAGEPDAPRLLQPLADRPVVLAALTALAAGGVLPIGMAALALAGLALRLTRPPRRG